jgi:hypothetical protein
MHKTSEPHYKYHPNPAVFCHLVPPQSVLPSTTPSTIGTCSGCAESFLQKITATDMKAIALSIRGWQFGNASAESARPMRVGVKGTFDGIITLN